MAATQHFLSFAALSAHLDELGLFRMRPGLERMRAVLMRMNLVRPPYALVQVAGTNGKGSVSTMLASLAYAHGLRTGLHCSPHFVSVRERVRLNGRMLDEAHWLQLGNELMAHGGEVLTYFEFVTILAALAFREAKADLAVMESGLGGCFDATTAFEADLLVFTPIGLDHQAVLGDSLAAIAADKAGAIRPEKPVISAAQRPEAARELQHAAEARNTSVTFAHQDEAALHFEDAPVKLALAGAHQEENASLALAAWRLLAGAMLTKDAAPDRPLSGREAEGLRQAWLPGRLQFVCARPKSGGEADGTEHAAQVDVFGGCKLGSPPLLLDGAHNGHALAALGLALARMGIAPGAVIFSCLADKDTEALLPLVRALATGPIFVPPIAHNPRAADPAHLAAALGVNARPTASLAEALDLAARHMAERLPEAFTQGESQHPLLICGSLYLLGELYSIMPHLLLIPSLTSAGKSDR